MDRISSIARLQRTLVGSVSHLYILQMTWFSKPRANLQLALRQFTGECKATGRKINTPKSEVMVLSQKKGGVPCLGQGQAAACGGLK